MSDTPDRPSDLSRIFDEYLVRRQRGESPTLDEYCQRFPALAEQLRLHVRLYDALGEGGPARDDPASGPGEDAPVVALLPGLKTVPPADALPRPHTAGLPRVPGYEVEALLGSGGMGVVYKARHLALKRTVALKMLAVGNPYPAERARFRAEAEAVARLQHPNIVQIHEIGEAEGRPFFALEYVAGGSLAERLVGQFLPPNDAARLVAALAEAMHLAHSRNLVHRDLKPGNVLLAGAAGTPVGQCHPKVTDFGLVRQLDVDSGQTCDGVVIGTPSYMAPEQAEGRARSAGPAADVYALGAILYECLTGRPPFQGATALETLEQVRTREPAAPSSLNRQVPRDLERICLKCLRKEPERRYSSAGELADDLGRFVRGEPVAARPVGRLGRVAKWARRNPTIAGLSAVAVLLALAAGTMVPLLFVAQARRKADNLEQQTILLKAQASTADELAKHYNLGVSLYANHELKLARDEFRAAIQCDPRFASAHIELGIVLTDLGMIDEACEEFHIAVDLAPEEATPHYNLGNALLNDGKADQAVREYRIAAKLDPKDTDTREYLGQALLLDANFADALAEFKVCRDLYPPENPKRLEVIELVNRAGKLMELERRLPALLSGEIRPLNSDEALLFALVCLLKNRPLAAAELYAKTFVANPDSTSWDLPHREDAARAAALAGCGVGQDAGELSEPQRAYWRKQSLDWLRVDLDAWTKHADEVPENGRFVAQHARFWQRHIAFSGLRDEKQLSKLPQEEREAWRKFWTDAAALVNRVQE